MSKYYTFAGLFAILLANTSIATDFVSTALEGAGYNEKCSQTVRCDPSKFLECPEASDGTERVCKCIGEATNNTLYINDQCLVRADSSCDLNENCIFHGECNGLEGAKTCKCKDGYVSDLGLCWSSFETPCSDNADIEIGVCSILHSLDCDDETSKCQCYPGYEWYGEPKRCNSLVGTGGTCDEVTKCPAGASCVPLGPLGYCKCDSGYTQTKDYHCKFGYATKCDPVSKPDQCNQDEMLICAKDSKTCSCDGSSTYWENAKQCAVKVGGTCDPGKTGPTDRVCIFGAECIKNGKEAAICQCEGGKGPSEDNTTCSATTFVINLGLIVFALINSHKIYFN